MSYSSFSNNFGNNSVAGDLGGAAGSASGAMSGTFNKFKSNKYVSGACLLYTSPSPRDRTRSRMPSSA